MPDKRFSFGQFVDRAFWVLLTGTAMYGASLLKDLGSNVADLNQKMAVIMTQAAYSEKHADDQDRRIERLEEFVRTIKK